MMSQRLAWLGRRQEVLAQNVANADTPGFMARDLKEPSFRQLLGKSAAGNIRLAETRPGHITPSGAVNANFKTFEDKEGDVSLSGNSVDVEAEMMKVAKTAMDHQLTINLYRKQIAMIKAALGRPGG
jgi:flagellar basal-body rod protein FlgB